MNFEKVVSDLLKLGDFFGELTLKTLESEEISTEERAFLHSVNLAIAENKWFTQATIQQSFTAWSNSLTEGNLATWTSKYDFKSQAQAKNIALILAGNIPLVGLHDIICVLISGHNAIVKPASGDVALIKALLAWFYKLDKGYEQRLQINEGRLSGFEAVIATGSDNSSRYFDYYFGKYPHIIRKNRTSMAVLIGDESAEELALLGKDILSYFGLGCRNVSHLMVPTGYDFNAFFEAIFPLGDIINHNKYGNNYEYHRAIYLLEQMPFLDNNFIMIRESDVLHAPLSTVHYHFYEELKEVEDYIIDQRKQLQCLVGKDYLPFGKAQQPELWDYADGEDTLAFLLTLA